MAGHQAPHPWDSPGKNTGVGCHFLIQCMKVKSESEVAQSCLTPSDPMDCSLPGPSVHGIFQARVLEWGAIAFSGCEELINWKRPWERLKAGGEGDDRRWDGWMVSPTGCTWVWVSSGSWLWTGKPGMLQSDITEQLNWTETCEFQWDTEICRKLLHYQSFLKNHCADNTRERRLRIISKYFLQKTHQISYFYLTSMVVWKDSGTKRETWKWSYKDLESHLLT